MPSKEMLNSDYFFPRHGNSCSYFQRDIPVETRDEHKDFVKWGQNWAFPATACIEVVMLVSKLFE